MLMIVIGCVIVSAFLFLLRSFKRSLLIEKGQARFVLEEYDTRTERLVKWMTVVFVFVLVPLLLYVKYFRNAF
jgi:hypothetical protein